MIRLALIALVLTGCATTQGPAAVLHSQGTALHELPHVTQPSRTGIEPGRYRTTVDIIYTATQEEATRRCNFGLPGGESLACFLETNSIVIVRAPRHENDWAPMCYLGHEVTHGTHGTHGGWHR